MQKRKIDSFTSMRFICVFIIMLSHFTFLKDGDIWFFQSIYEYIFKNSRAAVCYFFLISGFGLTYKYYMNNDKTLFDRNISYKYALNKVSKIYKHYIFSLIVCVPLTLYYAVSSHGVINGILRTIVKIPLTPLLLQSLTGLSGLSHAFNGVCWFLSTLFVIYMFYPIIYKVNLKIKNNYKIVYILLLICVVLNYIVYMLLYSIDTNTFFDDLSYASPLYRIICFFIGVLICDLYFLKKDCKYNQKIGFFELPVSVLFFLWYIFRIYLSIYINIGVLEIVDIIIPALWIIVMMFESGPISKVMCNKKLVVMGNNSMYIFLYHSVAVGYTSLIINLFNIKNNIILVSISLIMFITVLLCLFMPKIIEKIQFKRERVFR